MMMLIWLVALMERKAPLEKHSMWEIVLCLGLEKTNTQSCYL